MQKIRLMFVGAFVLAGFAFTMPVVVYAQNIPNGSQANQCQGDSKTCVCSTDKDEKNYDPNCGRDPAFANCTFDDKKQMYDCPEAQLQDCSKLDKKTQEYQDCMSGNDLFKRYINPAIAVLSFGVGLAVTIGIIAGSMQYISSAGDPQKAAAGKKHIWSAIFALIAYLLLFALLNFLIPGGLL